MSIEESLTYLQQVALKGEVGLALSTSTHNAEMKFRIYLILKNVNSKLRPFLVDCIKEAVTFDETIIDKIYLEVLENKVPTWLWIEEALADIKLNLNITKAGSSVISDTNLSISKLEEKKKIIESAFISFMRKAIFISPSASQQLLTEVQNDYDLSFLQEACFYLQSCCTEMLLTNSEESEPPEELMSCIFNIKENLNFNIEMKAISLLDNIQEQKKHENDLMSPHGVATQNRTSIEELLQGLNTELERILHNENNEESSRSVVYKVQKVFVDSGLFTDIRTCKTEEEALNFVKKIIQEYPELLRTCEFRICTEKMNGKRKGNS